MARAAWSGSASYGRSGGSGGNPRRLESTLILPNIRSNPLNLDSTHANDEAPPERQQMFMEAESYKQRKRQEKLQLLQGV